VVQKSENEFTAKLEFWRQPALMAQFPFAHNISITYRLQGGALEIETLVENLSTEPIPVSLGYHPYFQLHDAPRDEWTVHLAAKEQVLLSPTLVPTGEHKPNPYADPLTLKGVALDDVFTSLVRDADGIARFWVQGKQQRITVEYGAHYPVAVVYAPPGRKFICFEPMTAPTNAFNLAQRGLYKDLQSVAPGSTWRERYVIRPTGF
jgi:aldose 1-epimerase